MRLLRDTILWSSDLRPTLIRVDIYRSRDFRRAQYWRGVWPMMTWLFSRAARLGQRALMLKREGSGRPATARSRVYSPFTGNRKAACSSRGPRRGA